MNAQRAHRSPEGGYESGQGVSRLSIPQPLAGSGSRKLIVRLRLVLGVADFEHDSERR
jgi:hypothetical protein